MKRVHKGVEYDTMMVKSNLGQTREMEMSHCGKEGKNRILFSLCTLNYQITLSPATPKGANVGAVNVSWIPFNLSAKMAKS